MPTTNPLLEGFNDSPSPPIDSNANIDNYLEFINKAEGSPDYNTLVGYGKFNDFSKHPDTVGATTKSGPSRAAGKWQITKTTYDDIAPKLGITDFSPESQKKIALKLIENKGALEDIKKGDFTTANKKLGSVWASLPSSPYPQPKRSPEWVEENLKAIMTANNAVTKADEAQPQQVLDRPSTSSNPLLDGFNEEAPTETNPLLAGFEQPTPTKTKTSSYPGYVPFEGGDAENIDNVKAFTKSAVATAAKLTPAVPAMSLGAQTLGTLGTVYGGPVGGVAGAIVGGVGGLIAGEKATEKLYDEFMPEKFKEFTGYDTKTREAEIKESPNASRYGDYAGSSVLFRPGFLKPIVLESGKTIGTWTQRGIMAAAGGAFEAGSELVSGENLDPKKIKEASLWSAIAATPTSITTTADKMAANIIKKFKLPSLAESMSDKTQPKPKVEITLPDHPMPQDVVNTAEADARSGQVFTPKQEASISNKDKPVESIRVSLNELTKNEREAKLWSGKLEELMPDVRNREHVTFALEGQKKYDELVNEEQKRQKLYGDDDVVIAAKEARAERRKALGKPRNLADRIDRGMMGARQVYRMMLSEGEQAIENYNARIANGENPKTFTGFDRAWDNYSKSKGFPKGATPTEQFNYLKEHENRLTHAIDRVESRPHDTPNTFKAMELVKKEFKRLDILNRIEGMYEKTRQYYVTHALNFKGTNLNTNQQIKIMDFVFKKTDPRFFRDFSKARTIRYLRDLESKLYQAGEHFGIDTRGVIVEKDIAKLIEIYKKAQGQALIEKRLVNYLSKIQLNGNRLVGSFKEMPIITKDPKLAFDGNYVSFTGPGSESLKGYKVHPDFVGPLGFMFMQKEPGLLSKAFDSITMLAKSIQVAVSAFHATSLLISKSTAAPDLMLKEVFSAGGGSRMALQEFEHNGASETVRRALDSGLGIHSNDVQLGALAKMGKNIDNFIDTYLVTPLSNKLGKPSPGVKLARKLTDPLQERFINHLDRFTWDYMHTAGKLQLWQHYVTNITTRHPEIPSHLVEREVAEFVDYTLGGLNWLDIANKTQTKLLRDSLFWLLKKQNRYLANVALFAPDWTLSTIKAFTSGLPKELLKPKNWELRKGLKGLTDPTTHSDLARRYALFTMVAWGTLYNGIQYAITGKSIFDNKDPTRLDLGDGTTMQAAKHSMEVVHWVSDPFKTFFNKLGYFPKTILDIYKDPNKDFLNVAGHIVKPFRPFSVSAAIEAPIGDTVKRGVASTIGLPISGQTTKGNTSSEVLMERKQKRKDTEYKNKLKKAGLD